MSSQDTVRRFLQMVWQEQPAYRQKDAKAALPYKDWRGGGKKGAWSRPEPFVVPSTEFRVPTMADLYFCPCVFTGTRRADKYLTDTRWLYADLDRRDPRNLVWELQPTLALESSPGSYQGLWLLDRPIPLALFDLLNKALCKATKSDKGTWARYRVLRVPGTISYKRSKPWRVSLLRGYSKILYVHNVEEITAHLTPFMEPSGPSVSSQLPQELPTQAQAWKFAKAKLPPSVITTLKRGPRPDDDRSRVLWKLYHIMADNELSAKSSFVVIKHSGWNKFARRTNGDQILWREIRNAREAHRVSERNGNGGNGGNGHKKLDKLKWGQMNLAMANPVQWAWEGRWVLGSFNLLVGAEGVGKGTLAAWMLSQWSQGRLKGHLYKQQVGVGVIGDEDSWNDVWTPRLHVAGADPAFVGQIDKPKGGYINMAEDKEELVELIQYRGVRVLYLDALLDNLGAKVDDWKAKEVRDALEPIRWLARTLNVCIIGSLHPNKKETKSFRSLLSGSHAFNAIPRSSMFLATDPEDQEGTKRLLVRGKGNLGPIPPAVSFHVDGAGFKHDGKKFEVAKVVDVGTGDAITADDLLSGRSHAERPETDQILEDVLTQAGSKGLKPSEALKLMKEQGAEISERGLRYAAHRLQTKTVSHGRWTLPQSW